MSRLSDLFDAVPLNMRAVCCISQYSNHSKFNII